MATGESAWVTDIGRGARAAIARGRPRGRAARRLRLPDPHRHPARPACSSSSPPAPPRPIRGCCTSWTRSASSSGGWSSASAARAELERSNADLEAFAYVASHDLAEPLRSVAGFVALLERQYGDRLDDRAREFIAYAVDGVERMQRMIDDLLLYARAGTTDLRIERVDAGELVAGALRDLGTAVAERGASVEVGELPVAARRRGPAAAGVPQPAGQRDQVHRAGRRAAGDGQRRARADGDAEIAVADNGIGIDPAQVERAFEMFARIPGAAAQYQGTGLGLAISRRIVERHGGRLWVEPNAGGGSVFRLTLPLP